MALCAGCAASPTTEGQQGDACEGRHFRCEDDAHILSCGADGTWERIACRGPGGCRSDGESISCDESVAGEGERCLDEQDGAIACDPDHARKLRCEDGFFRAHGACPGCHLEEGAIACSWRPGDACEAPQFGCVDSATAMECVGNVLRSAPCMGPSGCGVDGRRMNCDVSLARALDPCLHADEGIATCSMDGHQLLTCHLQRWDVTRICGSCVVDGARVRCGD